MAAKQDTDEEMDDITDEVIEGDDDIEDFLKTMEKRNMSEVISNMTARRRIEELLEERRLRDQIEDYRDLD
jgi:ElaB/YqjD/DUF883 family membrane-anchored ribosome-binding protein